MKQRITGFDLARALAIFGMVIVNFKIAMNVETGSPLLMSFAKLFEGRASALFVILAGVGVTFLTNKARKSTDHSFVLKSRISLIKRGLLLVVIGLMYTPIWEADILHLEKEFQQQVFVKDVEFVSSQAALMSMKDALDNDGIELLDGESPIPPSISFHPKAAYANADSLLSLKTKVESQYSIVESFEFNERIVRQSNEGVKNLVFIIGIMGILLFFVALALINNTIRLSLYSKRFLIKTMQMVGATSKFIRKPFIVQSLLQGFISALVASALLLGIIYAFATLMPDLTLIIDLNLLIVTFSIIFVVGLLSTMMSTFFALKKYFRLKLDDLY